MRIEKLHINRFRGIADAEIKFECDAAGGGMTLLDGNCGRKVLDAVQIAAGTFLYWMPMVKGCKFRLADGEYPGVSATFTDPKAAEPMMISRRGFFGSDGRFLTTVRDATALKKFADDCRLRRLYDYSDVLPLFVFNGARRVWDWRCRWSVHSSWRRNENRLCVFEDADRPDARSNLFAQWYVDLWYAWLDGWIRKNSRKRLFNEDAFMRLEGLLGNVRNAVDECLRPTGWGGLDYETDSHAPSLRHNGQVATIKDMTGNEEAVLGAVADLAARCCVLNQMQGEKALVNTHGIVLLDWRELSAEWIPQTLEAMRRVFPRIQFIVATGLETLADRTVKIR